MNCPNCATLNPEEARFCFNCGAALVQVCNQCGTNLQHGARFCHNCGQPVSQGETSGSPSPAVQTNQKTQTKGDLLQRYIPRELLSKLESARDSRLMEGERRVVTILFCDIKGSTLAASGLDPEEWAEIINGAFEHMIEPIYQYEGTVARLQGDGLLAFFGAPIAHEDDPQRALLAGLDIVQEIHQYGQGIKDRWGIDFNVRVGINTGLVVVGAVGSDLRVEYTALGDAINLAARMEQHAEPGTILVAEDTYKLVAPLFDFKTIEGLEIKGREAPVTAYQAIGPKVEPGKLRGLVGLKAPLIGRKIQMDRLQSAIAELNQGSGQILSVIGEAGLGKSRLIEELHKTVEADPTKDIAWLEGRSLSFEVSTPFAPFINLFNNYFEMGNGDPGQSLFEKLLHRIEDLFPGQSSLMAPFLGTMLNLQLDGDSAERVNYLEPPQLRGMIFTQVAAFIEGLATSRPTLIYLDDLHWADSTSLELLQTLMPMTDRLPLMIIAAFRPHRQEPSWSFHERAERDFNQRYQMVSLQSLNEDDSRQLVASLLKIDDLPGVVRQKILDKAEGNPFYVEELIRSLLDAGLIVRVEGHWQATREIENIVLPDTLVGVITARLDRLDDPTRRILQAAAVLGREFSTPVLKKIAESQEPLARSLGELLRRDLIQEKDRIPQPTYTFKHVLTQEAAYNSILLSNRRELHRRGAEALIAHNPEAYGEIARHWLEARQTSRAMPYLVRAGESAARAYATQEAIDYYRQVIELQPTVSDLELLRQAYEGLGRAYSFANRIPEAQATFQDMLTVAESADDLPMQISALNKLAGVFALSLGDFQEAERLLARAESLSRQHGEKDSIPEISLLRCQMCTAQADFSSVVETMSEVIHIGEELGTEEHIIMGLAHAASSLVYLTEFDEAQQKAERALTISREIGDREHEAFLLSYTLPMCYIRNGDIETGRAAATQGLEISTKIGALGSQAVSAYLLAEISRWQGEYESALSYGKQSMEAALPLEPYMPFLLVPSLGSLGNIYLEISEKFRDEIAEFHLHALRLLESPVAKTTGGTAWADLGHCAIALGDLSVAGEALDMGLNYPNMFMHLERPRHLSGAALLACTRDDFDEAVRLAEEGCAFAKARGMRHLYPFTQLILGKVLAARGDFDAGMQALEYAEREARSLNMTPITWKALAAASQVLVTTGQAKQAEAKRSAAKELAAEIANRFKREDLRQAFEQNIQEKLRKSTHPHHYQ